MNKITHEFALYSKEIPIKANINYSIKDIDLVRRISSILRLQVDNKLVLFNEQRHVFCVIFSIDKKNVIVKVDACNQNKQLTPLITVMLPILKRDALDAAIYSCVELGATSIQLVITQKTRELLGSKEFERLHRVMIAAAEQSKQFAVPILHEPKELFQAIQEVKGIKIFADPDGKSFKDIQDNKNEYTLLVGPEADLTLEEKDFLIKNEFFFCRLTPTVLRARQAVALLLGMMRTFIR